MQRYRFTFVTALLTLVFAGAAFAADDGGFANPRALVSAAQLEKMIADNTVKVIDARGSAKYLRGHIKGAINISISDLDVERNGVPMMFPDAKKFAQAVSKNGITNDDFVVIYDDVGGHQAARLAWLFMQFGHFKVALLDGAWGAWKGETSQTKPAALTPSVFKTKKGGNLVASIGKVKAALGKPKFVILDTRALGEYKGEVILGSEKGGRIPGAVHVDWEDNMNADKTVKSAAELKKMYAAKGVTPDKTIIAYCYGGYRASFSAYVLKELLGYPNVTMYDGSWLEWDSAGAPIEK